MKRWITRSILILTLVMFGMSQIVFAAQNDAAGGGEKAAKAKRTIMLYACGSNLETDAVMATYNLRQVLKSQFSSDEDIRFIVMTGGSYQWHLEKEYLEFPDDVSVPKDAVLMKNPEDEYEWIPANDEKSAISGNYNQLWEAKGVDAKLENGEPDPNAGKMVLIDGDGITGAKGVAVKSKAEMMSDPDTLKAFINFGVENYPAEKYDLILWDHGSGPQGGFGSDEHFEREEHEEALMRMPTAGIMEALSDNAVTKDGGKFDFVDFDACLMSSIELALLISDYTDYYIASADTEPGYGQYYGPCASADGQDYTGWLDELGDPAKDELYNGPGGTFALGKVIVDDFNKFYDKEKGDGFNQEGTLAVIDIQKMMKSDLVAALNELNRLLKKEAEEMDSAGRIRFYDEVLSYFGSIHYSECQLYDLPDLVKLLGVVNTELYEEDLDGDTVDDRNAYTDLSLQLGNLLRSQEEGSEDAFLYAKGTRGIKTTGKYFRNEYGDREYGDLYSGGLTLFFPDMYSTQAPIDYCVAMDQALASMPEKKDGRYEFMKNYESVVAEYSMILYTGKSIDWLLNEPEADFYVGDKSKVDYDLVMKFWKAPYGPWDDTVKVYLSRIDLSDASKEEWLRKLINQQIEDAISADMVTAAKVKQKNGEGYRMTIHGGNKRIIESVERNIIPELPVLEKYLDSLDPGQISMIGKAGDLSVGSVKGELTDVPEGSYKDLIHWYNESGGTWEINALEPKWYAVHDADGVLHVASIDNEDENSLYVPGLTGTEADGEEEDRLVMLEFSKEEPHVLKSIHFMSDYAAPRPVDPANLTDELTIMPILYIKPDWGSWYCAPISKASFKLSKDNADSISLKYVDIDDIKDIEDTDYDGKKLNSTVTVTNMYRCKIDVTDAVRNPTDGALIGIELARVKPALYDKNNVRELSPEVVYRGETLTEGVDYIWEKVPIDVGDEDEEIWEIPEFKEPGEYHVNLTGKGRFTGMSNYLPFNIILPEEEAAQMVADAQAAIEAAAAELEALPEDATAEQLKAAYEKLVRAQNALADAQEALNRTQQVLSDDEKAQLQEKIGELEDDVQDLNEQLAKARVIDISNYAVTLSGTSFGYTGKAITPKVKVAGLSASDYIVAYSNNVKVGTATVKITPIKKKYKGEIKKTFKITKGTNTLKVKGKKATVKYKKLKKKNQSLKVSKVIKVTKKGQGKLTYQLVSAKKGSKNFKKKFSINKKNGKVTVKKGLKKGTYKLKVKVKASGNTTYKAGTRTVTVTIKVKK